MFRLCRWTLYAAENVVVAEEDHVIHGRTTSMNGQASPALLCIMDDRSRWATITAEAHVRLPQRRPGVMGI